MLEYRWICFFPQFFLLKTFLLKISGFNVWWVICKDIYNRSVAKLLWVFSRAKFFSTPKKEKEKKNNFIENYWWVYISTLNNRSNLTLDRTKLSLTLISSLPEEKLKFNFIEHYLHSTKMKPQYKTPPRPQQKKERKKEDIYEPN